MPLLWIGMLFFLTSLPHPMPGGRPSLTDAAPMPPKRYALARCAAALTGGALLTLLCMVEAAVFYGRMFHWYSWGSLLLPALVTLLPALVFALGQRLAGRPNPALAGVCVDGGPFLLAALPLPEALGLWNGSFFTAYPMTLETLDPAFVLPVGVTVVQAVLLAAGTVLLILGGNRRKVMR